MPSRDASVDMEASSNWSLGAQEGGAVLELI